MGCSCNSKRQNPAPMTTVVVYQDGHEKSFASRIAALGVVRRTPGAYLRPITPTP